MVVHYLLLALFATAWADASPCADGACVDDMAAMQLHLAAGDAKACQDFFDNVDQCKGHADDKYCGCDLVSKQDTASDDSRCCLLGALNMCLAAAGKPGAASPTFGWMTVNFDIKTDKPTEGWWILGQGRLDGKHWKFASDELGTCKLFSSGSYVQYVPEDWSGNFYAAPPEFTENYKAWAGADQQTVKVELTVEADAKSFNWDLSAIPNNGAGECLESSYEGKKFCGVTFNSTADANCPSVGKPSNPTDWKCQDENNVCSGTCPGVGVPYRYGWWGTEACYDYDQCKKSNGGWCSYFNQRGYLVTAAKNITCKFNEQDCDCDWGKVRKPPKEDQFQCSYGTTDLDIGGAQQDCFTAPHDDRKDMGCSMENSEKLALSVDICLWGDKKCDGSLKDPVSLTNCEGKVYGTCPPPTDPQVCPTNGKCCTTGEKCPDFDPMDTSTIPTCSDLLDEVKDDKKLASILNSCRGQDYRIGQTTYACMTLRQNHPFPNNCEPDNFKADETAICGDEKPLSFDSEYHWTRYTCEKTAGKAWCKMDYEPLEKCEKLCPKDNPPCDNCYDENHATGCYDQSAPTPVCAAPMPSKACFLSGKTACDNK